MTFLHKLALEGMSGKIILK